MGSSVFKKLIKNELLEGQRIERMIDLCKIIDEYDS